MKELLTLSLTGVFTMIADMFNLRKFVFPLALFGLAMTISWSIFDWDYHQNVYNMMQIDNYALAFTGVMCVTAIMWLMMSEHYFSKFPVITDRFALVFFALVGSLTMVSYTNLVMLFIGIEILSISLYVLAGSSKKDMSSSEAAFKYFLMGAFASGFLLFGIALIYGVTGSFDLLKIQSQLNALPASNSMVVCGVLMILIGLGFKLGAAPFHFWTPDVYQGSPIPVTAFMATIVKTAAIGAMYKIFLICFSLSSVTPIWGNIVAGMIILTLLIGNITAVAQTDAKRMLAFSSISHAGYVLLAVLCVNSVADNSILFYMASYSVATITAFMVLYIVNQAQDSTNIEAFKGLGKKNPLLAFAMTLALLSMAGIPPLAGFMGKYYIFINAISEGHLWIVLFAIIMSLVGFYYYFKIIIAMFFQENTDKENIALYKTDMLQNLLLIISCGLLLILGLFPQLVYNVL